MTLDERIKLFEQEANDMEQVADTGVCMNGTEISFLYADDTECIDEHIERLRNNVREYRQIANWLKELKRYKELQKSTLLREATPEELESVNMYIRSISKPTGVNIWDMIEETDKAIKISDQESNAVKFAKWVATEIFDDNWEYNKDAFEELACRKLAKLGIVKADGDEWKLVE